MELTDEQISKLATASYGAPVTVTVAGDLAVRCKVEIDDMTSINDSDCDGKVSDGFEYWRNGHSERPSGFDGAARKIGVDRGVFVWWQPWDGFLKLSTEEQRDEVIRITDLLRGGYHAYVLELCKGADAYEEPIVVAFASLWGVESNGESEYIKSIISDLWVEIEPEGSKS